MNFGTPVPLIVGLVLIVASVLLFFLGKFRPGTQRDSDNVYAFLGLFCGVLLIGHLGLDPLLSLQQMIMVGMLVTLMWESISNRTSSGNQVRQAGGSAPFPKNDDRPLGRSYRADFDNSDYPAVEDLGSRQKIRGRRDDYSGNRPSARASRVERDRYLEDRPASRRRSRIEEDMPPVEPSRRDRREDWPPEPAPTRSIPSRSSASEDVPRPRRRRPPEEGSAPSPRRRPPEDSKTDYSADYVDFRPVEPKPPKESWGPTASED